jgi:hypothetical protein
MSFYHGERFMYKGCYGTVIRRAEIDENGADFYYAEINYVVKMDSIDAPVTYNIRSVKIMTERDMVKL